MSSKKITVTDLDFDLIKQNLKNYYKGQSTFQDYDFDGSALSVLMDLFAYNTHYNALYNNLSINEMFIDSARKRNSVVSKAKEIGYRPKSAKCASAVVDITYTNPTPTVFTVTANSPFTTSINGVTYTFYNESTLTSGTAVTSYTFKDVVLTEKTNILSYSYTVASGARYIIPNQNVDVATIKVKVQDTGNTGIISQFTLSETIVDITSTSKVYWIKELDDGLYELVFGNGIIGSALSNGNVVNIEYAVSSLDAPNGARLFSYGGSSLAGSTINIATTSVARDGAAPEDIDSIRFNAPRAYTAQNRIVTPDDCKAIIYQYFPAAQSVSVWGGEDNIPPVYGKMFVCIKPIGGDYLTQAQQNYLNNTLFPSKLGLTIKPVLVPYDSIDILLNVAVYFNPLNTTRSAESIKNIVLDAIDGYNNEQLQGFDGVFRYSKLSKIIDSAENSITNNITTVTLKRSVTPKYNIVANYVINLINPIYYSGVPENIVLSSGFYIQGSTDIHYLVDDGVGNITLFTVNPDGSRTTVDASIGSVDYGKGKISISNLNITSIVGDKFIFYIKPSSNDVVSALTQLASISMTDLNITVISDTSSTGDLRAGQNYIFTTSRI